MNGYDGLTEEQFYEMMSPEYRKKWPTEIDTLCKENDKESLADKYIEERNKARQYREKRDNYFDRKNKIRAELIEEQKKNRLLQKEVDELKGHLISYRLGAFTAKVFNKLGYVRK